MYLELDPGNFEAHVQRGTHLLLAGKSEEAAAALKTALELQPDSARGVPDPRRHLRPRRRDRPGRPPLPEGPRDRSRERPPAARARRGAAAGEAPAGGARGSRGRARRRPGEPLRPRPQGAVPPRAPPVRRGAAAADALIAAEPKDPKAAYLKVTIAEARRDFAAAATLLEGILSRPPAEGDDDGPGDRRVFLVHLGFAYQQLDRYAEAAEAFARAKDEGGPPEANLLGFHVEALYLAKHKDEALAAVRAARASASRTTWTSAALEATLLREKGDAAAATALVEAHARQGPRGPTAKVLGRVADFYRRAGRLDEAEEALREALAADPKSLASLFQLGAVLERQKRHDDAEAVFREALVLEPDSAPVLNYLGYMNADRNVRVEEALVLIAEGGGARPAERRLPGQPRAGRSSG